MKIQQKLRYQAASLAGAVILLAPPVFSSEESDWLKSLSGAQTTQQLTNSQNPNSQNTGSQNTGSQNTSAQNTSTQEMEEHLPSEDPGGDNMAVPTKFLTKGNLNGRQFRAHADLNLKRGNIDESIKLLERALEINPTDLDSRTAYANALEKKVFTQKPTDPHTYNLCLKQWLYIYKKAEFLEDNKTASNHLKAICGQAPKRLQSAKAYLASVMLPDESEAPGDPEPLQVP